MAFTEWGWRFVTNYFISLLIPLVVAQSTGYKYIVPAVSKAQHGCIDCLALMICAELRTTESFPSTSEKISILGKKGGTGWFMSLVCLNMAHYGIFDIFFLKLQGMLPQETLHSVMWSINLYTMKTKMVRHLSWLIQAVHSRHQSNSLFVCAWLMFSSVLARKSRILARNPSLGKFFHVLSILLRYFSYWVHNVEIPIALSFCKGCVSVSLFSSSLLLKCAIKYCRWYCSQRLELHASRFSFQPSTIWSLQFFLTHLIFLNSH